MPTKFKPSTIMLLILIVFFLGLPFMGCTGSQQMSKEEMTALAETAVDLGLTVQELINRFGAPEDVAAYTASNRPVATAAGQRGPALSTGPVVDDSYVKVTYPDKVFYMKKGEDGKARVVSVKMNSQKTED